MTKIYKLNSLLWQIYYSKVFRLPLWLWHKFLHRHTNTPQTIRMRMGHQMKIHPTDNYLKNVLYTRQYHDENIHLLRHFIQKDAVILDIGANIGLYSCGYAQKYNSLNPTIHAIEALESNFKLLKENIALNSFPEIKPYQLAIGLNEGVLNITVPSKDFVGNAAGDNIKGDDVKGFTYQVPMQNLDAWAKQEKNHTL